MLAPGTILQNRYRIIGPLGRGGMGTVYEALDQRVNAVVALKETDVATDGRARRDFEREAGLLANLQHQALPKVMDYFVEGDKEYLVMEHISGYDLLELLERRGSPFHVELVLQWADAVLDVLEYLHQRQPPILHRDVKPANLKLTPQEDLFLIDFGLAKGAAGQMATLLTSRSAHGYTPVYSPLEQIIGQGTDQRSDLYSLGATLYHLLTGAPPTDAATRYEQLESGRPDPLLPIQQLNPKVPPGVAGVIHQAMAIARKDRHESATIMREALSLAGERAKQSLQEKAERQLQRKVAQQPPAAAATDPWRHTDLVLGQKTVPPTQPAPMPPPPPSAPARRKTPIILIAVGILALTAIVVAYALTRRTSSESRSPATINQASSPQPTETATPLVNASTPTPAATPVQTITESLNGVKLEMVLVPGGTFMMGSPEGVGYNSERPQHTVTVRAFYMSKYEVTQAQYKALMGINVSEFQGDDLPVENVSWDFAKDFCDRLTQVTGRKYRLPTEAEWEYAARAGTTTAFSFGNSLSSDQANFDGNSPYGDAPKGVYRRYTTPVGSFAPNGFGLYDMHGNVWEWCEDTYHNNYTGAPRDGSAWIGGPALRVVRGGSWISNGDSLRSAIREREAQKNESPSVGFRVVAVER
ncbi:MAG TPA: bifunctional serine/threonine-protein kinase/formylglycine-generating enzyme family protein [Pyrinomonadaceae bacterium]